MQCKSLPRPHRDRDLSENLTALRYSLWVFFRQTDFSCSLDTLHTVSEDKDVEGDDCIWDAGQERDWRERRFLRVEKEGNRDPSRGNSGTVR